MLLLLLVPWPPDFSTLGSTSRLQASMAWLQMQEPLWVVYRAMLGSREGTRHHGMWRRKSATVQGNQPLNQRGSVGVWAVYPAGSVAGFAVGSTKHGANCVER